MTEEEEATYKYAYDKKDRVISQTNPLGASSTFKYDGNDNVTESVDETVRLPSMLTIKMTISYPRQTEMEIRQPTSMMNWTARSVRLLR